MYSIVKYCELSNVDNDGDHLDDEELGEERVEAQVALVAQQVTFLPTVSSAAASRSIWARGASSQMVALSWQGDKKKGNFIESLVENGVRGYNEIGGLV